MPAWIILTVIGTLMFSFYQSLAKILPKNIPIFLATAYAFLFGSIVLFIIHLLSSSNKSIIMSEKNIPILIGIGALQSGFVAVFNPASVTFGVILGFILWQEKLSLGQIAGILLSIIGILFIVSFKK